MRKTILIDALFFTLGLTYMYLDSQEYYTNKLEQQKMFYTHAIASYQDSLEVSRAMVGNSYDAFYTVSRCSNKHPPAPIHPFFSHPKLYKTSV